MTRLPGRWPCPPGRIAEQIDGLLPAQHPAVTNEFFLPIIALPVPALVYKLLVLSVRNFESIDIERGKIVGSEVSQRPDHVEKSSGWHSGHSFRGSSGSIQPEVDFMKVAMHAFHDR